MERKASQPKQLLALGAFTAFLFFALETVLFSGLQFVSTYFLAQLILSVSLVAMVVGGAIASLIKNDSFEKYVKIVPNTFFLLPYVGLFAVLISFAYPVVGVVLLTMVFVPLSIVVTVLYKRVDVWLLYSVELLGAVTGLAFVLLLLPLIREENVLLLLSVISAMYPLLWLWKCETTHVRVVRASLLVLLFALAVSNMQEDRINFAADALCDNKFEIRAGISKIMCLDDNGFPYEILRSLGSVVNRIDLISIIGGTRVYGTAYSGTTNDVIQPYDVDAYKYDARIPDGVIENPKVLILGAGAEGVVKVARAVGSDDITVVEFNPAIISLWENDEEIISYGKNPFKDTKLVQMEGRTFLEQSDEGFDMITLMNTHRTRDLGEFGQPDFLHTVEAFSRMYQRLTDSGMFIIEEPSFEGSADSSIVRVANTIKQALIENGIKNPEANIVAYEWVGIRPGGDSQAQQSFVYTQFLVSKNPWTKGSIEALSLWADKSQSSEYQIKDNNMAFRRFVWVPVDMSFIKQETNSVSIAVSLTLGEVDILYDKSPFVSSMSPFDVSVFMFALLFLSLCIVVANILMYRKDRGGVTEYMFLLYFVNIGLGYMAIEIFLLQWLQLYIGSVFLSFVIVIGGLFVSGGLTSILFWRKIEISRLILVSSFVTVSALLLLLLYLPLTEFSFELRVVSITTMVVLIGAFLAPFFPFGITKTQKTSPSLIPLFVGVNGSALALSVPVSIVLGAWGGFIALIAFALLSYIIAIAVAYFFWYRS